MMILPRFKQKVFCIGHNKTGTTSIAAVLETLDYKLGRQRTAERLLEDWGKRNFKPIIDFCKRADAFQDVPFSLEYTYIALDQAFPDSKFILTVRDSPDQWFDSLTRYHSKLFGSQGALPTPDQLREFDYRYKGWLWRFHQLVWDATDQTVYDKQICTAQYNRHNAAVCDYFKNRPQDLLILNLASPDATTKLADFLGVPHREVAIPHLNQS